MFCFLKPKEYSYLSFIKSIVLNIVLKNNTFNYENGKSFGILIIMVLNLKLNKKLSVSFFKLFLCSLKVFCANPEKPLNVQNL